MKVTAVVSAAAVLCLASAQTNTSIPGYDATVTCLKDKCTDGDDSCANDCMRTNIVNQVIYVPINNAKRIACQGYKGDDYVDCVVACINNPELRSWSPSEKAADGGSPSGTTSAVATTTPASDSARVTSADSTSKSSDTAPAASASPTSGAAAAPRAVLFAAAIPILLAGAL